MSASRSPSSVPAARQGGGPGRPKDPGKREAILAAARTMFLEQGYNGASMDAIATAAGVSKLTVYSHFGDKESLFNAAVHATCSLSMLSGAFGPVSSVCGPGSLSG